MPLTKAPGSRRHGSDALTPEGHDPNSFFVSGGNACDFQRLLEEACL